MRDHRNVVGGGQCRSDHNNVRSVVVGLIVVTTAIYLFATTTDQINEEKDEERAINGQSDNVENEPRPHVRLQTIVLLKFSAEVGRSDQLSDLEPNAEEHNEDCRHQHALSWHRSTTASKACVGNHDDRERGDVKRSGNHTEGNNRLRSMERVREQPRRTAGVGATAKERTRRRSNAVIVATPRRIEE